MSDSFVDTEEQQGDLVLEDGSSNDDNYVGYGLASFVEAFYHEAREGRRETEERWIESFTNYRGIPTSRTQFTKTEESDIFVKITKTKVNAAYGMLHEILFPNHGNTFPIMVKPTPQPEGVDDAVHLDPKAPPVPAQGLDGEQFKLGPFKDDLEPLADKLRKGPGVTPGSVTFDPAQKAAEFMDRKMQDQFAEGGAHKALKKALFDTVLYGTGVVKGPYTVEREYPYWDSTDSDFPKYSPKKKMIPVWEWISIWDFYADNEAEGDEDIERSLVRHRLNKSQLRGLKRRPQFRKEAIDAAIEHGASYQDDWWENEKDDESTRTSTRRYDVLEFWGTIDVEEFREEIEDSFELPDEYSDEEELNVCIWVCNGEILRFSVNAYRPQRLPFHVFRYEVSPGNFHGVGLGENMADTQLLMNGFMRLTIDNAIKSGNLVLEMDEDALAPGQDPEEIYPGKIFRRQTGAIGQAITSIKWQNTTNENMLVYDKVRQLADESTGLPSFSHGQPGITGIGRTASGISMFMGAASTHIKTIIKGIDDVLQQWGSALFSYNMTFDYDEQALGDVTVYARGTDALINNEIRGQRISMLIQQTANPIMAPFVKWQYVLREAAKAMDLDPDKFLNNPDEAMKQAMMMQALGNVPGMGGGAPGGAAASDTQGAGGPPGMTGTGIPQQPGSQGFSANKGAQQ